MWMRAPLYRTFARVCGADLTEMLLPLEHHGSLGAFFVRRLAAGARPFDAGAHVLPAPADGTLQAFDRIERGTLLQAKGQSYSVRELLGGIGEQVDLEGGLAWTIYLGPRDYHRVHAPHAGELRSVRWLGGTRFPVRPNVLATRKDVLARNERCVLFLEGEHGPQLMVLVGALNVGRIRVVGVEPGHDGPLAPPRRLERGDELARFELGSTVVLLTPSGVYAPAPGLSSGMRIRMGQPIGTLATSAERR
jgi:phosphatidylserine decarboxylase